MTQPPPQIKRALENLYQALERLESALVEFEESFADDYSGRGQVRPQPRGGLDLLTIPEICQELGMSKSWVYQRIRSGKIPSVKLGHNIKVRREALEEYLDGLSYHQESEE